MNAELKGRGKVGKQNPKQNGAVQEVKKNNLISHEQQPAPLAAHWKTIKIPQNSLQSFISFW